MFLKLRKQRYVYGTILENITQVKGIIKFDLHATPESGKEQLEVGGNVEGIFKLGPGRYGSEAIFVPRQPGTTSEEDDGYLIFFVHDENTGYSLSLSLSLSWIHCCSMSKPKSLLQNEQIKKDLMYYKPI